jgi:hypothetical protein
LEDVALSWVGHAETAYAYRILMGKTLWKAANWKMEEEKRF